MSSPPTELLRKLLEASAASPLEEADPASLDELMSRMPRLFNLPPLETTEKDVADIMLIMRTKRALFSQLASEKAAEDTSKPRRGRRAIVASADEGI